MSIGDYLSALFSFEGRLDKKRYQSLMAPAAFVCGALNFVAFLFGFLASWKIGGWILLTSISGNMLAMIPLATRRARDIGWLPILAPVFSLAALMSIAAFLSLLLPVRLGIWRALEHTGFGLVWWGLIFAACIGIWSWWTNSLLDRPTKGAPLEERTPSETHKSPERAPVWLFVIWTTFWGAMLLGGVVQAGRYYLTGEVERPPWLAFAMFSIIGVLAIWHWLRSGRDQEPKA